MPPRVHALAVDDHHLHVVAVVDVRDALVARHDHGPRRGQCLELVLLVADAAEPVVEDVDLHAGLHAVEQDVLDLGGQLVLLPDEVHEVDVLLGGRHLLEEGGELLRAGRVDVHGVGRQGHDAVLVLPRRLDALARCALKAGHRCLGEGRGGCERRSERALGKALHLAEHLPPLLRVAAVVPADEEVGDHADHRQQHDHEQPREHGAGIAVVGGERDDDRRERQQHQDLHHPVDDALRGHAGERGGERHRERGHEALLLSARRRRSARQIGSTRSSSERTR